MRTIACSTQFCAVIGNPVSHSLSPAIHNAGFEHLDLDFVYVACPVEDVKSALTGMRALGNFRGMSVTIPHKIDAMKYVDEVSDVDRSIGSINTIIKRDGRLIGLGTDGAGALKALTDAGVAVDGKHVLMLGAGGAARAIAFTLARLAAPAGINILDIKQDILAGLLRDLREGTERAIAGEIVSPQTLAAGMERADIVINCSPVGMHPRVDATPVPADLFRPGQIVFDVVYTPLETRLLAEARARGLIGISGVEMFLNQAVLQFKQFTGVDAPADVMRKVLLENLKK